MGKPPRSSPSTPPPGLSALPGGRDLSRIVLIHGGGGTAFSDWVWLWAKRGYAAIAMDLSGHRPPRPSSTPRAKRSPTITTIPPPAPASGKEASTRDMFRNSTASRPCRKRLALSCRGERDEGPHPPPRLRRSRSRTHRRHRDQLGRLHHLPVRLPRRSLQGRGARLRLRIPPRRRVRAKALHRCPRRPPRRLGRRLRSLLPSRQVHRSHLLGERHPRHPLSPRQPRPLRGPRPGSRAFRLEPRMAHGTSPAGGPPRSASTSIRS